MKNHSQTHCLWLFFKNNIVIFLSCLFLLSSCNDESVTSDGYKNYFPLQIGNEWSFQYEIHYYPSGDTIKTFSSKITKSKIVNGREYFAFDHGLPFLPYSQTLKEIIGGNSDSIYIRQNEKGDLMLLIDDSEWLFYSFNPSFLDSIIQTKLNNAQYGFVIESINDTVNTPIGLFKNCYKILNGFGSIRGAEYYTWFAPNYGPVKIYYPEFGITYNIVKICILNNFRSIP